MSVYIGKANDGNNILHVSSDERTEAELKSVVPLPTTAFNSRLQYLKAEYIGESGNIKKSESLKYNMYGNEEALGYETIYFYEVTADIITEVSTNTNPGSIVIGLLSSDMVMGYTINGLDVLLNTQTNNKYFKFSNVYIHTPGYKYNDYSGVIVNNTYSNSTEKIQLYRVTLSSPPTGSITLQKDIIQIGNTNFADMMLLSTRKVNETDPFYSTGYGDFQVLNSNAEKNNYSVEFKDGKVIGVLDYRTSKTELTLFGYGAHTASFAKLVYTERSSDSYLSGFNVPEEVGKRYIVSFINSKGEETINGFYTYGVDSHESVRSYGGSIGLSGYFSKSGTDVNITDVGGPNGLTLTKTDYYYLGSYVYNYQDSTVTKTYMGTSLYDTLEIRLYELS